MSRLNDLIQKLCPDGVEYAEVSKLILIAPKSKYGVKEVEQLKPGEIPAFTSGNRILMVQDSLVDGQYIFMNDGGNAGAKYYDGKACYTNHVFCFTANGRISPKFLFYVLQLKQEYINNELFRGSGLKNLCKKEFLKLKIPVPPLEIQKEIVKTLDAFTKYDTELQAELQARIKQYEYYRDKLLTFDISSKVRKVKLGEICDFQYGFTDKARESGDARFVRITDINDDGHLCKENIKYVALNSENQKYRLSRGDLLVARTGATYGKVLYIDDDAPAVYASFLIKLILNQELILNRYFWHFAKSNAYWSQASKLVTNGGQQQFNANVIKKIEISLPPLEIQNRIVHVLDNFDAICSDLKIGLPAEIEKRQQQYEFYRDAILTFVEKGEIVSAERERESLEA